MLLTVGELHDRVLHDLPTLIDELSDLTGRGGSSERKAWQRSLPRLTEALTSSALDEIHVHFAKRAHSVSLEYQLPGASAWCDVVLLGRHMDKPSAVIIELKDWETKYDRPGVAEGLIERRGVQELHPSDQVRGYVEYCQRFHSAIVDQRASVHGFVLFTTGLLKQPYLAGPNSNLTGRYPVFSMAQPDLSIALPEYLRARIAGSDEQFATDFVTGTFRQERGFMRQIGQAILEGDVRQFELLDNQRRAMTLCLAKVREAVANLDARKSVIVIEGPPGSGKSAVAAKLWANLVADEMTPDGNICLVTTSQSQSSNWTYLIDHPKRSRVGRGIARKATSFSPIDTATLGRLRKATGNPDLYKTATEWRSHFSNLQFNGIPIRPGAEADSTLVSLVDEAHALINPEREHGVGQYGFVTGLGPQAFHIIRCSRIAVFFIDPDQSFRSRENTTIQDLHKWALDQGATFERISLHGVQFRCAGSAEYVAWIESLLCGNSAELNSIYASAWHQNGPAKPRRTQSSNNNNVIAFPSRSTMDSEQSSFISEGTTVYKLTHRVRTHPSMEFRVFSDPFQMERELRKLSNCNSVRLVSTYSRPWKTRDCSFPHTMPPEGLDFCEPIKLENGETKVWSRPWNFVPDEDYSRFIAGRVGSEIANDPLCEVGCTYAVRGFDFDYLGVLWLNDLLWHEGKWMADLTNVHESGISTIVKQARKEGRMAPAGPRGANVLEKLRQAYRILFTRAIKGIFVWIPDEATRFHVLESLGHNIDHK